MKNEKISSRATTYAYKYDFPYNEDSTEDRLDPNNYKYTPNRTLFIQMELCETTLEKLTEQINTELNQSEQNGLSAVGFYIECQLFIEIVEAVNYLHSQKPPLIHRDIKPLNILVNEHSNGNKFLKITDFGLTTHHEQSMSHTSRIGSTDFIAPEVLAGRMYDEKSDIYSIGVVMSKMFFMTKDKVKEILSVKQNDTDLFDSYLNFDVITDRLLCQSIKKILIKIISLQSDNPQERPNLTEIINKVSDYLVPFDKIKCCKQLTDIYYKWSIDNSNHNSVTERIFLKNLKLDLFKNEPKTTSKTLTLRSISSADLSIETNIGDKQINTVLNKQIIHGLNFNQSIEKLIDFIERQLRSWKCFVVKSSEQTINNLIKALSKHFVEYYIMYDKINYNSVVILMNLVNYCMINFMRKKFKLPIEEINDDNDIEKLIDKE